MFPGYQPCQLIKNYWPFRDHLCRQTLMMCTEMVPEMSVICNQLTRLIAREDFINFNRGESFGSYKKNLFSFRLFNNEQIGIHKSIL
jgi:hypothetical protein